MFEGLLQPTHLLLVLVIGLIVFGPGKLGELGGQLGRGVREFRESVEGGTPAVGGPRFCGSCGAAAGEGSFCAACGARLGSAGS